MGAGFPVRAGRDQYGPTMRDQIPVKIPETDLSAAKINLDFWQSAGMARTAPLVRFDYTDSEILNAGLGPFNPSYQGLVFDPNSLLGGIQAIRVAGSDGAFEITLASSYPDETGVQRALNLFSGMAWGIEGGIGESIVTPPEVTARVKVVGSSTFRVYTYVANVQADASFGVAVW